MQQRDRVITFLGAGGVIVALLWLSRCGGEPPEGGTALSGTRATGERAFPFTAPTNRPPAYDGPSLDQLIQQGARNRADRFAQPEAGGPIGDDADARAMFEGERIPPRIEGPGSPGAEPPRRAERRRPTAFTANAAPSAPVRAVSGAARSFPAPTAPPPAATAEVLPSQTFVPTAIEVPSGTEVVSGATTPRGGTVAGSENAVSAGTTGAVGGAGGTAGGGGATTGAPFVVGGIDLSSFFPDGNTPSVGGGTGGTEGTGGTGGTPGTGAGGSTGGGTDANRPPVVGGLSASPSLLAPPGPIALTATGVTDPDAALTGTARNTVSRVQFFRDSNNNNAFDPGTDEPLGADSNPADGFGGLFTAQASWGAAGAGGPVRVFARAQDERGAFSAPVSTLITLNRSPTLASLGASPAFANPGTGVTLTVSGASDPDPPGAGLSEVEFYQDVNADGVIDGADIRLGAAAAGAGALSFPTSIAAGSAEPVRYLARARDELGALSSPVGASVNINRAPNAGSLVVTPGVVTPPGPVLLQASGFVDPDGGLGGPGIASIEFFRDVDGDGIVSSADTLVGSAAAASGSANLTINAPTDAASIPTARYLARGVDAQALRGPAASAELIINRAPVVSALSASPSARVLAPLTLTASASDADPAPDGVALVRFFVDTNGDGVLDEAFDELLGTDTSPTGGFTVTVEARAAWAPSRRFFARALDGRGASSTPVALVVPVGPFPDSVLRVKEASGGAGGGPPDGLSWPGAFPTIGQALSAAARSGGVVTHVWVGAGAYSETVRVTQPVTLLGGFAGVNETDPSQRDWAVNVTVIDPAGAGRAVEVDAVAAFEIDGFTIRNGAAESGAGLRSSAVDTVVAHCVFRGNTSAGPGPVSGGGGAVHLLNAGAGTRVVNCLFHANSASVSGAAVLVSSASASALMANCTVAANDAPSGVAAVRVEQGSFSIFNTIVALNGAGGISAGSAAATLVSNCNLFGNVGFDAQGPLAPVAAVTGDPRFTDASAGDFTLAPGSPCLDAGTPAQPGAEHAFDLAHRPRRVDADATGGPAVDVGAFERPCAPPACPGDLNGDGSIDTSDLVGFLGRFGAAGPAAASADLNGDGAVNTTDLVMFLARFGSTCPVCTPP